MESAGLSLGLVNQHPAAATPMAKLLRAPKFLKVGTDFSGMEMPLIALRKLGVRVQHEFSCDITPACEKYITKVVKPKVFYKGVESRKIEEMPTVDAFFFSPPCQPFSTAGRGHGETDERGQLVIHSLRYIKHSRPRLAVMENVATLLTKYKPMFLKIKQTLQSLGYVVFHRAHNAKFHGVPQNRNRLYLVAIREDSLKRKFRFPIPYKLPKGAAKNLLNRRRTDDPKLLPTDPKHRAHVKKGYKRFLAKGIDPKKEFVVVDIGASMEWALSMAHVMPTLTATRASTCGWWLSIVGRQIELDELFRFQGLEMQDCGDFIAAGLTPKHIGHMLGNSLALNVIERVLSRALWSAGLVAQRLPDRWAPKSSST